MKSFVRRLTGLTFLALLVTIGCKADSTGASSAVAAELPPATPAPVPKSLPPSVDEAPSSTPSLESHQFYGVYLRDQKAGWAEERIQTLDDGGVRVQTRYQLRIQRLNNAMTLELVDEVEYAPLPGGGLRRFMTSENLSGGGEVVRRGHVEAGKLQVTIQAAGNETSQMLPLPKENASDILPALLVPRLREAGEQGVQTWMFDRQQLKDIPITSTLLSERETRIQGVPATVLEIRGVDTLRGITMTNRVTAAGRTLEMAVGPGLKIVLEDRDVAKNPSLELPDLYRLSAVPVDQPLGLPGTVRRLKLRLTGLPSELSLTDARQQHNGEELEVRQLPFSELAAAPPLLTEEREKWLEATPFIDHEDPSLRALVRSATEGRTGVELVHRLKRAVYEALSYTLATAPLTASDILAGRKGDCTEYARLLTALARAAGIPAREVSGMVYSGDTEPGFAFHAWVEVWIDGRWYAMDPTWNQAPLDATHITLSRDDAATIVGLIGGLEATVIEIER